MLRLKNYLKPYSFLLLASIIILFVQAMLDLALPDYLAQIVNTGVQLGGIKSTVSEALGRDRLEELTLFMSAEDESALREAYTLVQPDSAQALETIETYPILDEKAIYVRNDLSQDEIDRLSAPMARAWVAVSGLERVLADPQAAAEMLGAGGQFDLSAIPPGTDLSTMLSQLPTNQRAQLGDRLTERWQFWATLSSSRPPWPR